jgi:manganese-dependent inorganic pyrophosphatase
VEGVVICNDTDMAMLVFGHKNPDTDSVASACAYAWMLGGDAEAVLLGNPNREALCALEVAGMQVPRIIDHVSPEDTVALVDTNNPEELISFDGGQLHSIVDHHKLVGGLATSDPITVHIRPVGCTCTLLWGLMVEQQLTPPREIAVLMAAAIISDTINLSGPTTTDLDREVLPKLMALTGLDVHDFTDKLFTAKSDLTGLEPEALITTDSKAFTVGSHSLRVSVLETVKPDLALEYAPALREAMAAHKQAHGVTVFPLYIVDILNQVSYAIAADDTDLQLIASAHGAAVKDDVVVLPGVVSRKKQMIPALEKALA